MNPFVFQINIKPISKENIGLPKEKIQQSKLNFNGLENDYNHYRYKKKTNRSKNGLINYIP